MKQVATSRTQNPKILKQLENGIGNRERPKTMLTPVVKRAKKNANNPPPSFVDYPKVVAIPSKHAIKALYEASLEEGCEGMNERISGDKKHYNDQQYLTPAGILSFENVLLPAIGLEEEKALKRMQSKLQRDDPEYQFLMENCRRLVRQSVRSAMQDVQSSRSIRYQHQQERKHQQLLERNRARETKQQGRKEENERLAKELARKKEMSRAEKKRYLAREHPRNQKLWKEIVFLTSSVTQLEREERMWIQIEQDMKLLNSKQIFLRKEHTNRNLELRCDEIIIPSPSPSSSSSSGVILLEAKTDPLQSGTEEKVKDIVLTSTRIQKGLEMILKLLTESEILRKKLYDNYKKDHIFRGYQAVHNPKSMIRFLSQSQDDHL